MTFSSPIPGSRYYTCVLYAHSALHPRTKNGSVPPVFLSQLPTTNNLSSNTKRKMVRGSRLEWTAAFIDDDTSTSTPPAVTRKNRNKNRDAGARRGVTKGDENGRTRGLFELALSVEAGAVPRLPRHGLCPQIRTLLLPPPRAPHVPILPLPLHVHHHGHDGIPRPELI
jgi:hypothetical protein